MLARFGGPLYVTDDYIPGIYTEIFNILILSVSPSEVQRQLLQLCSYAPEKDIRTPIIILNGDFRGPISGCSNDYHTVQRSALHSNI